MTRMQAIKKIMNFIVTDGGLNFEQRLVLIRGLRDLRNEIDRGIDPIEVILLRLRYGVKQEIPTGWVKTITIPKEIEMAGDLVDKPVPRGYVVRGGEYRRPTRLEKSVEKIEKEKSKSSGGIRLVKP